MSSRSNFSPGGAGSMKSNVNVNLNTAGGNKKQGITSRVTTDAWTNSSIQSDSNGMNRNIVFTQNQLGGVGVGRSMFKGVSNGADGSSNKGPYFYGGKDYLEFPKAQGFESFPYGLSASNGNNKIQVTTTGVLLTTGISSIMLNDTIDIIGNMSCSGTIDVPGMNTTVVDTANDNNMSIASSQTTGVLNIGTGLRTTTGSGGGINIGTGAGAIPIVIGSEQSSTSLRGTVNVVTKLTSPTYDASDVGVAMTIGSNLTTGSLAIGGTQTGNISLGAGQTTGILNIGTGSRTTSGNGGAINIGTGENVTAPINIGGGTSSSGSINIGHIGATGTSTVNINTSTAGSHPVNIGSTSALTTIGGDLTVNERLTPNKGITCPTISPTLDKTNLLYTYTFNTTSSSSTAVGTTYLYSPTSNSTGAGNYLNAGIYAVFVNSVAYEIGGPSTGSCSYTLGVCYGTVTGSLSTSTQYGTGTVTNVSKSLIYQRLGTNNIRIGNNLAGTFTLTSTNFVNIQIIKEITVAFTLGNFWTSVDGLIIRIG